MAAPIDTLQVAHNKQGDACLLHQGAELGHQVVEHSPLITLPIVKSRYCNGDVVEDYCLASKTLTHVPDTVEEVLTLGAPEVVIEEHLSRSEYLVKGFP